MTRAARPSITFIELCICFIATAILVIAQLAIARATLLISHPLWLDECLTKLIANDPSFTHAISAIRNGVETNPPTLYLFLWPIGKVTGGWSATGLRIVSLASMLLATTGLYAIGRRYFATLPCAIGVLSLWANPIIVEQAFEARFYGPWLAATAWYCYLSLDDRSDRGWRFIVRILLAILIATLHWFGAIAIALLAIGELIARRKPWPLLIGALALAACIPFYLGQRAGLTVPTWIEPTTFTSIRRNAVQPFFRPPVWTILLIVCVVMRKRIVPRDWQPLAPTALLALFPLALSIFSLLVQPTLFPRYLILAMIPWFVLTTALAAKVNRWICIALIPLLVFAGVRQMRTRAAEVAIMDDRVQLAIDAIERAGKSDVPIVFVRRIDQYPIVTLRPDLAPRIAKLDFDGDDLGVTRPSTQTVYERDMGRRVTRMYPQFRLIDVDSLRQLDRFIAIAPPDFERDLRAILHDFEIARTRAEVFEVRPSRR